MKKKRLKHFVAKFVLACVLAVPAAGLTAPLTGPEKDSCLGRKKSRCISEA